MGGGGKGDAKKSPRDVVAVDEGGQRPRQGVEAAVTEEVVVAGIFVCKCKDGGDIRVVETWTRGGDSGGGGGRSE